MTSHVMFYAGIILLMILILYKGLIFRPRQRKMREEAEKNPDTLDSWKLQFRKKVIYIWVAQMACIFLAISGLIFSD